MLRDIIEEKLTKAYTPDSLHVVDESHLHEGHAGARPEGETHFRVHMVSAAFEGLSRIDRQRQVFETLKEHMDSPIHALALKLKSPLEADGD